jgi:hypothetical protein
MLTRRTKPDIRMLTRTKHELIIKLIAQLEINNLQDDLLSLINPSLPYVYYSTTLSNHGLIRLN